MSDTKKKVSLRELDDVACSNVVVTRQIKKMIRKFPSMNELAIDCWIHGGHYTKFKYSNDSITWIHSDADKVTNGYKVLKAVDECLDKDELNKLLVTTFNSMCDNMNNMDFIDTPEDLLSFAESKLQEMLRDESIEYK